jgi:hypothetical protein
VRDVEATDGVYDVVPEKTVEHFFKSVKVCWNEKKVGPNEYEGHDLIIETVPVVNLATSEHHEVQRCKTCHLAYTKLSGRAATPDEIAQARAGKIPFPTSMTWAGKGGTAR